MTRTQDGVSRRPCMGWLRDVPSIRDHTHRHDQVTSTRLVKQRQPSIREMRAKLKLGASKGKLPTKIDLREWCSPIEDQGGINSCTANAGVGLLEYFERRAFGRHIDASRLFLYKATRNLLRFTGDNGAYLRSTMEAMTLFGVPPEEYWPYDPADVDKEPTAFCYSFAQNYQAITYYRLDPFGTRPDELLQDLKSSVAKGLPLMFGFTVFQSRLQSNDNGGQIPFPAPQERIEGGHAVVAVGYDDKVKIDNSLRGGPTTIGAFLIRNSWGAGWGDGGYGWLPYDYVLTGMASDWWSILRAEWVDTGRFG